MTIEPRPVALDTNILIYAEGYGDAARVASAIDALGRLRRGAVMLPTQAAAEFLRAMTKRFRLAAEEAALRLQSWQRFFPLVASDEQAFQDAFHLFRSHRFQIFDALILASANHANCSLLVSEDMQDGFVWKGTTVVNPFAPSLHPLLASYMSDT